MCACILYGRGIASNTTPYCPVYRWYQCVRLQHNQMTQVLVGLRHAVLCCAMPCICCLVLPQGQRKGRALWHPAVCWWGFVLDQDIHWGHCHAELIWVDQQARRGGVQGLFCVLKVSACSIVWVGWGSWLFTLQVQQRACGLEYQARRGGIQNLSRGLQVSKLHLLCMYGVWQVCQIHRGSVVC